MPHFPACHILFPTAVEGRHVAFFLATEEYVAKKFPKDSYFFTWRVPATCIFGINQDPRAELNLDFCRANHIQLCRRKSGGGTVFAEQSNLMLSLITESLPVEELYAEYAQTVAQTLRSLGAPVQVSGRNDIETLDHRKICGNAFYRMPCRNIVHGTMLYDTDLPLMLGALTPSSEKLTTRGVKSVRSRIGLLKDYLAISLDELRAHLIGQLTDRTLTLSDADMAAIEQIEQTYYDEAYLWGRRHNRRSIVRKAYIAGCGTIEIHLHLTHGHIDHIHLQGDYFETGEQRTSEAFSQAFAYCPYTPEAVGQRILRFHPEQTVVGLGADQLAALLCQPSDQPDSELA